MLIGEQILHITWKIQHSLFLSFPVSFELMKRQSYHHICSADQLTGFYIVATFAFNELILWPHNLKEPITLRQNRQACCLILLVFLNYYNPVLYFTWKSAISFAVQLQMTGFYMNCSTGLKWVKLTYFNWNSIAGFTFNCF